MTLNFIACFSSSLCCFHLTPFKNHSEIVSGGRQFYHFFSLLTYKFSVFAVKLGHCKRQICFFPYKE